MRSGHDNRLTLKQLSIFRGPYTALAAFLGPEKRV